MTSSVDKKELAETSRQSNDDRLNRIKAEMGMRRTTMGELAEFLGITIQAFSKKIKGDNPFKVSELEWMAAYYEKDRAYFF